MDDSRKIIKSLDMMVAQLKFMLVESDHSVLKLTTSFEQTIKALDQIEAIVKKDDSESTPVDHLSEAKIEALTAIKNIQFYDRLSQRIRHVQKNLLSITTILKSSNDTHEDLWKDFERRMSSVYSTSQEHALYTLMSQEEVDVNKVTEEIIVKNLSFKPSTDIELF